MGQNTAILLKKNFGNNRSTISLIHHQWGIGKTMPAYLTQEILKSVYPLDRNLESLYYRSEEDKKLPLDYFYTFEPLNNENNNYITNKEVKTDDPNEDIWNTDVRVRYGKMTDNNNGLMLVEVTQLFDDTDAKPRTYGDKFKVKVGFALGYGETSYYHKNLKDSINLESEFIRLVDIEEYVLRTWSNPKAEKYNKEFVKACRTIFKLEDIEEVYDKKGKKLRAEKEKHIKNCIEALTKNLKDHETIEVPMEFQAKNLMYL